MDVRAYPFQRLPRLARSDLRSLVLLRPYLTQRAMERWCEAARPLLGLGFANANPQPEGVDLRCTIEPPERLSDEELRARLRAPLCAFLFEGGGGGPRDCLVVEADPGSAALLVDRVLGGDGSRAFAYAGSSLDDMSLGVLAYFAARMAAALEARLLLRCALAQPDELVRALGGEVMLVPLRCHVAGQLVQLRVIIPSALLLGAPTTATTSPTEAAIAPPAWLSAVAVSLWANAGRSTLPLMAARTLALGDVVVLDHTHLVRDGLAFHGGVTLHVGHGTARFRATARDRELMIDDIESGTDRTMTTGRTIHAQEPDTTQALGGDTPIELSVELARFTVTLAELSQLRAGDVLTTGRRIGEAVTLRAGGAPIAHGELVDVDGELGVRVLAVLRGEPDQSEIV